MSWCYSQNRLLQNRLHIVYYLLISCRSSMAESFVQIAAAWAYLITLVPYLQLERWELHQTKKNRPLISYALGECPKQSPYYYSFRTSSNSKLAPQSGPILLFNVKLGKDKTLSQSMSHDLWYRQQLESSTLSISAGRLHGGRVSSNPQRSTCQRWCLPCFQGNLRLQRVVL